MGQVLAFLCGFSLVMFLAERRASRNRLLARILPDVAVSDPRAILSSTTGEPPLVAFLRPLREMLEAAFGPVLHRRGIDELRQAYERAGRPGGMLVEEWYLLVLVLSAGAAAFGLIAGLLIRPVLGPALAVLAGIGTRPLTNLFLRQRAASRARQVRTAMLGWMEALTTAVESGAALGRAIRETFGDVPGLLGTELALALREAQADGDLAGALARMADAFDVPELTSTVTTLARQMELGGGVAGVLRAQAHDLREARRARAEEVAGKAVLKLLFPAILVLLATLIVLLWPALARFQSIFG